MSDLDNVVQEFLVESYENLDQLDQDLVALEDDPGCRETLDSVFRTVHTIKGTCGFLGFDKLGAVTHTGENLLGRLREGELTLDAERTTALLQLVDAIRTMLGAIEADGNEGAGDYTELMASLARLTEDQAAPEAGDPDQETTGADEPEAPRMGELLVEDGLVQPAQVEAALAQPAAGDPRHVGELTVEQGKSAAGQSAEARQTQQGTRSPSIADASIRVDVNLLDKLMNLVGELVLARNQILQFSAGREDPVFAATSQRLNLVTTELQEEVMKTRMQPIGNVWNKLPRVVRDLALGCGKQVRIVMDGKETELDKTLIEAIKDPLTHLVRNAVDHGVEKPEDRVAAGKAPEGVLSLRAFHEGGQVNIEISDDGAGLDLERLRAQAVRNQLFSPEAAAGLTDREVMNLIFAAGFSTAEEVTNVSGRGVGMDVVKTNIEKIGGTVDISSIAGQGTTIRIKIPLTLAIIPALIITSGGEQFAIPQVSLLELVRLDGEQVHTAIETIHGAPVHRLRGDLLPLAYLNDELGLPASPNSEDNGLNIVVLQADDRHFGLVVDGINDTEEIVVKPLSAALKGQDCFAGATIMGDGRVALILDVLGIAQRARILSEHHDRSVNDQPIAAEKADGDLRTLLLFAVGASGRMAIPLDMVARLEEFTAEAVEMAGSQPVVQYRDQIMPLLNLGELLDSGAAEANSGRPLQVVVYRAGGRSVGLVVDRILDIVSDRFAIQPAGRTGVVLGSAVIGGLVTELIDVRGLIESADPSFFEEPVAA